jgi:hypothetical protein
VWSITPDLQTIAEHHLEEHMTATRICSGIGTAYAVVAVLVLSGADALACPFCSPSDTFTVRIDQAYECYAVEWVAGREGDPDRLDTGSTEVRIRHVFKTAPPARQPGDALTLTHFSPGQPGQVFLLFGQLQEGERVGWDGLLACSAELSDYLVGRPAKEITAPARLHYFIPYLEHADEEIAVDAYAEFANASYEAVKSVAAEFPTDQLIRWVTESTTGTGRIARNGFYGMVIGLCGGEAEAAALERIILTPGEDFRIGIDGVMGGYLLLRGEAGLDVLQRHVSSPSTPSSEDFAFQQAVRFVGEYARDQFSRESLCRALRPLVDDPQFVELALVDLARWGDLSLVDLLIDRYGHPDFANFPTQTAIVRYYAAIAALDPAGRPEAEQTLIHQAEAHFNALRARDPELVASAERILRPGDDAAELTSTQPPILAVSADEPAPGALEPRGPGGLGGQLALAAAVVFAVATVLRRLRRTPASTSRAA